MQKYNVLDMDCDPYPLDTDRDDPHYRDFYLVSDVDARIAELEAQVQRLGGMCADSFPLSRIAELEKALASLLHFSEIVEVDEECDFFEDFTAAQEKARSLMVTESGENR